MRIALRMTGNLDIMGEDMYYPTFFPNPQSLDLGIILKRHHEIT